ncbi:MAG: leucine-rich repeat protein [Butyribacter sp.]|nr:leucine-rich repeat protein [bacterium]MDY3854001.1 leucine-rich repeat protein [Butyribacter sp.]
MKFMKKAISFVLMMALCLSGTSIANAVTYIPDYDGINALYWVDNICYNIDFKDNKAQFWEEKITGDTLVLPESITFEGKKYPVTGYFASDLATENRNAPVSKIQHIILPDTIEAVSVSSKLLPNLKSINIPKNAEFIYITVGSNVKITVPADQKYYYEKNNALYSKKEPTVMCLPLAIPENYTVAEGTTKICSFNSNRVVKKITLPKSVTAISQSTFSSCENLKTVNMEKTQIKKLRSHTFSNTAKLTTVKLPKQLKTIGEFSFSDSGLEKLTLPKHLKKIEDYAFDGAKFKKIVIPDSVTYFGSTVFRDCTSLKEVVLPKNLRSIGTSTFENCIKLKKITFRNTKTAPKFVKKGTIFKDCPKGIKLYVKNKKVAKSLKKQLMKTSIKKAKIYAGKKLVYKNVTGKEKIRY